MGGLFGSTVIKGNRITDFAQTTATVGVPIPFGYGRFVVDGNIIWASLPPKEHVRRKKQGKGGVKTETYTYTTSYAVAFAQKIYGFWWIKRNGKVVYTQDPKAPIEDRQYAAKWLQNATMYLGVEEQLPDSTIEAKEGVGKVSAFRGLSYIVVEDDDVTDGGGAIPSYEACVIASPPITYVTSCPYPALDIPGLNESVSLRSSGFDVSPRPIDTMDESVVIQGGSLNDSLVVVNSAPDQMDDAVAITGGSIKSVMIDYPGDPEAMDDAVSVLSGSLKNNLAVYNNHPPEALNEGASVTGGSLT